MIAWIFSRIGSGSGSRARRQLSLDQIEGRTKRGLGRITPISDTDEMGELLDNDTVCLARDSLHSVPETWFTQLAFGESPDAVENV